MMKRKLLALSLTLVLALALCACGGSGGGTLAGGTWTQQEVDALILMSRIIGEYIRQRRSSTLLRESAEATRATAPNRARDRFAL